MPPSSTSSSEPRTYGFDGFRFPVAGILCVLILLAAEGGLRAARGAGAEWAIRATRPTTRQVLEGRIWGQCRNLPWLHPPGETALLETRRERRLVFSANSEGFHDVEHRTPAADGGTSILILGDSHAAYTFSPPEELWPRRLDEVLRANAPDTEIFNLAVGGTSTAEQYSILQVHASRVRPRVVLLQFTANDVSETSVHPCAVTFYRGTRLMYSRPEALPALRRRVDVENARIARRLSRWSMLIRGLHYSRGFAVSYSRLAEVVDFVRQEQDVARRNTLAYLQGIERMAEQGGARFCVVWDRWGAGGKEESIADLEWVRGNFRPSPRTLQIDTAEGFDDRARAEGWFLDDGEHLTAKGHDAMAAWIAERMEGWLGE